MKPFPPYLIPLPEPSSATSSHTVVQGGTEQHSWPVLACPMIFLSFPTHSCPLRQHGVPHRKQCFMNFQKQCWSQLWAVVLLLTDFSSVGLLQSHDLLLILSPCSRVGLSAGYRWHFSPPVISMSCKGSACHLTTGQKGNYGSGMLPLLPQWSRCLYYFLLFSNTKEL